MIDSIDFRRLFGDLPSPYLILDTSLTIVDANAAYLAVTSRSRDDLVGRYVFDAFPEKPEREDLFRNAFREAIAGNVNTLERQPFAIMIPRSEGGGMKEGYWNTHQVPVHGSDGAIVGVLQKAVDVTTEVDAERTRDVVLREFDHRLRNLLGKVTAIARRTARHQNSLPEFLARLDDRLSALSRTQNLLMKESWDDIDIVELIDAELAPYRDPDNPRIHFNGPNVRVAGNAAQALGMAFHELATNAAKYGALSVEEGQLNVDWSLDGTTQSTLRIEWQETGFSVEEPPTRTGFGSTIIDRITPQEIHGTVTREFNADGHLCTIEFPALPFLRK